MGVNRMTGTPWHLETLRTNDARRHKQRCVFFCKDRCFFLCEQCRGSAHCEYYREKDTGKDDRDKTSLGFIGRPRRRVSLPKSDVMLAANKVFSVGQKIEYREPKAGYSKKYKYRVGIIKEIRTNALKVEFTGCNGAKNLQSLSYPDCVRYIR